MGIYRKLKDYIHEKKGIVTTITSIFGTLASRDNILFVYERNGEQCQYETRGYDNGSHDYLLEYYVASIFPKYKIENDRIIPYLYVYLKENIDE